jgi:hypothetical protein
MNNKSTMLISTLFILFILARNIMETSKTTWNYAMIAISLGMLAYNGYQFYQSRR